MKKAIFFIATGVILLIASIISFAISIYPSINYKFGLLAFGSGSASFKKLEAFSKWKLALLTVAVLCLLVFAIIMSIVIIRRIIRERKVKRNFIVLIILYLGFLLTFFIPKEAVVSVVPFCDYRLSLFGFSILLNKFAIFGIGLAQVLIFFSAFLYSCSMPLADKPYNEYN